MEQLGEVTRTVHAAMFSSAETPVSQQFNKMTVDTSVEYPGTDIQPTIVISNYQKSHVQIYNNDLGHNVHNSLKLKKSLSGEYVNSGFLVDRTYKSGPNDEAKYISLQLGNGTL